MSINTSSMSKIIPLLLVLLPSYVATAQNVSVRGSDSMLMLGQRWSQRLAIIFPAAKLSVNGGGIQVAAHGMSQGSVDVVQSSRKLTAAEVRATGRTTVEFPVAIESVVFYVNDANPVKELTVAQLRDLYLAKIDNWKNVGGPNLPVTLVSLETFVGGTPFVKEVLLDNEEVDTTARGYTNPREMAEHLAREKGAIGFGPLMPAKGFHAVAIKKGNNFPAVIPTSATVRSLEYPLSRYLYWSVGTPMTPNLRKISDWVLSSEGQLIVESLGYYPLDATDRSKATGAIAGFN